MTNIFYVETYLRSMHFNLQPRNPGYLGIVGAKMQQELIMNTLKVYPE